MKSRPALLLLRLSAVTAVLCGTAIAPAAESPAPAPAKPSKRNSSEITLDIDVRTSVDRPFKGLSKAPRQEHGKLYGIASVTDASGAVPLIRKVKEGEVLKHLREALAKRGFQEITGGEKPEIVLTVFYGRGFLRNPYLSDVMYNETTDPPTATILGGMPTNLMRQKEHGFEERLQKANFEKLFIRVTAWEYHEPGAKTPKGKKIKPRELWKTDMIVDDPAHRDLNLFIKEMFAAGGPWFDREMDKEEVTVSTDIPEGKVILGPLSFPEEKSAAETPNKK
jgi:hypothetical protein